MTCNVGNLDRLLRITLGFFIFQVRPSARPDAITSRNADRIQSRMIFQGANAPSNKMTEYYLQNRRGIVSYSDFIVNVGGVGAPTLPYPWITTRAPLRQKVESMASTVLMAATTPCAVRPQSSMGMPPFLGGRPAPPRK